MFPRSFLLMTFCVLATLVRAQQTDSISRSLNLETVTVTSSMIPTSASRTGRNIITLKGADFLKLPVNSVDELLRYVPGVEVQSRGPMGSQSDFVLRGGTFQQVLVILDGNRVNDPNSGHFTSYIPITPAQIERIEILKGASSAVYGSDAVGGVINIITKAFAASHPDKKDFTAQITGGQYGLFNANAGGFAQWGKTSVDGGLLTNNAGGQQQRGAKGYFHNTTASLSVSHPLNANWSVGIRSTYDSRDFAAQNFYTSFLSDTATEKVTTSWNQLRLVRTGTKGKFAVQSVYKNVHDTYTYNGPSNPNKSTSELFQTLLTYEHHFAAATTMMSGVQFQNRLIDSNDRGHHAIRQGAAFVIVQQTIGDAVTLSPALRVDYDERSGTEIVPQLNASYAAGNFQLRGSAGKTIRQADFTERYNNYNKALVTSGRIGNPDLAAEKSFSYEAGADYWLFHTNLKISATVFQQEFSKLIDYVTTPYTDMPRKDNLSPAGTYALAKNISDVTTQGAEADIFLREPLGHQRSVFASVGFLWLSSKTPEGTPSLYLSSHAKFLTNFSAGFTAKRLALSVTGLYKVRTPQTANGITTGVSANYFVLNTKAQYFLTPHVSAFLQVDNLGDRRYSDVLGSIMPGRWGMGGVSVRL